MTKFRIAATDRATGETIYARRSREYGLSFRTGLGLASTPERRLGLHTHPASGDLFEIEEAGQLLAEHVARLMGSGSWFKEPRIILG